MTCITFGLACGEHSFSKFIAERQTPYSVAHYLFETGLVREIEQSMEVSHNYIYQGTDRKLVRGRTERLDENTKTHWLAYLNLPVIKFIFLFFSAFFRTLGEIKRAKKDCVVLSTVNWLPVALGVRFATKLMKIKDVIIFTDCSVSLAYKSFIKRLYARLVVKTEQSYDAYIFFSEPMNDLINKKRRPWCVMEGFLNENGLDYTPVEKNDNFTAVYSGTLMPGFGLENLIEAAKQCDDVCLEIIGGGDYEDELKSLAGDCDRIVFKGFMSREELFCELKRADVLVNTRDPAEDYTRYSFPSKTFEYLASGTPFLSTKLDCYPSEYEKYILFFSDPSVEGIAVALSKASAVNRQRMERFGATARAFVLREKCAAKQAERVIGFLNDIL